LRRLAPAQRRHVRAGVGRHEVGAAGADAPLRALVNVARARLQLARIRPMDLILWRHAEAEDEARGGDLARALTLRGRAQAERMAAWLGPRLPGKTRIVASPARRCQETAA